MLNFRLLPVALCLVVCCSCTRNNPVSFGGQIGAVKAMKIELGNIASQRRHSVSSYSGSSDGVDTTSYVHTYSFDPASYDVQSTSFQDSDTTLICTVDDTGNMITITMTLDAERRFIRSLKVDEWHRSYYPNDITTRHNIETREILFISETAQQYTAEVRGTALQPVLKRLDYSSVDDWHSNGPSWRREEFSLLPGYTATPDSYLRITLLK